jgi:hypothetical protein
MNIYYLGVYAGLTALLAYGLARLFFGRAADRGMGASQWLFVGLLWFVMMLMLLFYQRYLRFIL